MSLLVDLTTAINAAIQTELGVDNTVPVVTGNTELPAECVFVTLRLTNSGRAEAQRRPVWRAEGEVQFLIKTKVPSEIDPIAEADRWIAVFRGIEAFGANGEIEWFDEVLDLENNTGTEYYRQGSVGFEANYQQT